MKMQGPCAATSNTLDTFNVVGTPGLEPHATPLHCVGKTDNPPPGPCPFPGECIVNVK